MTTQPRKKRAPSPVVQERPELWEAMSAPSRESAACPHCRHANPKWAAHCQQCGISLREESVPDVHVWGAQLT